MTAVFDSQLFGRIELHDGGYVQRELAIGARTVTRSLYIADELAAHPAILARAAALVDTLETLDPRARAAIAAQADGTTVHEFVAFHREEVDPAVTLADLDLVGAAVHAREPDGFALVLDYSFGRDRSDQLLAVRFDPSGAVVAINHES